FSSEDDFEDETNASETQNYAGWILRRLIDAGWLEQEQQADYTESSSCPYRRRTRWKPGCANTRSARRMQNEATDPYPADQLAPL
ncbi:MAG: hypothetical protein JXA14_23855, partial [Anaerolineae bacterium]|nr:hypothetical protein [Anaerolineae bacterium]